MVYYHLSALEQAQQGCHLEQIAILCWLAMLHVNPPEKHLHIANEGNEGNACAKFLIQYEWMPSASSAMLSVAALITHHPRLHKGICLHTEVAALAQCFQECSNRSCFQQNKDSAIKMSA